MLLAVQKNAGSSGVNQRNKQIIDDIGIRDIQLDFDAIQDPNF